MVSSLPFILSTPDSVVAGSAGWLVWSLNASISSDIRPDYVYQMPVPPVGTTFQLVQARYMDKCSMDGCRILFGICDAGSAQEQSFEVGEHCILSKNVRSRVLVPAVPFHLDDKH
jgi:hypothetical protein